MDLRPYQDHALDQLEKGNQIIDFDPGLGKTVVATETARYVMDQTRMPTIYVTIKTCVDQVVDHLRVTNNYPAYTFKDPKQLLEIPAGPFVLVTYYEQVVRFINILSKYKWSCVICDEAHLIMNADAQRTRAVKKLQGIRKIALTGTIIEKHAGQLWSILNFTHSKDFGLRAMTYRQFTDLFAMKKLVYVKTPNGPIQREVLVPGIRNPTRFKKMMNGRMVSVRKSDVEDQLPPLVLQPVKLAMGSMQRKLYDTITDATDLIVDLGEEETVISNEMTRIIRQTQCSVDPLLLGSSVGSVKLDYLQKWIEANPDHALLVFTTFVDTAKRVHAMIEGSQLIAGDSDHVEKGKKYYVGTFAKLGTGLDFPDIDYAIFLDFPNTSIQARQAIDRIHRMNSTRSKLVQLLYCDDTVDPNIIYNTSHKMKARDLIRSIHIETKLNLDAIDLLNALSG